ncbi:putative damage-inducible protein DinB [Kineococcus xinjiangensis]|uniref:Putative damage-inducible protein DinB n=1 Tax=Kineococcus xinjiangensis TaxID=512762 RepID=A0A2S6IEP5_9ACTN|nr:putative damage-inducible protein DinB [Kineococcus xinjiangensis]
MFGPAVEEAALYRRPVSEPDRTPALLDGPGVQVADPHQLLTGYLDWYRQALRRKLDGLSEEQMHAVDERWGWSPLGLVQHLGWVERRWMVWGFAAQDVTAYPSGDEEAEWTVPAAVSAAEVWDRYDREVHRSRALAEGVALEERAHTGGRFRSLDQAPTLGRILFHLLQEYARHLGHLDVARQLLDGTTGE